MVAPERIVRELAEAEIGGTFNQYREGARAPLLRRRLVAYLESRREARILLVGEAAGYRGARVSGIPFTSERQLTGQGPAEATATIVHRVLAELELADDVLLWNVVPTHPGTERSNRAPTGAEVEAGRRYVELVGAGRPVVAVGRVAEHALAVRGVRHPSRGGAVAFRDGLRELLGGQVFHVPPGPVPAFGDRAPRAHRFDASHEIGDAPMRRSSSPRAMAPLPVRLPPG